MALVSALWSLRNRIVMVRGNGLSGVFGLRVAWETPPSIVGSADFNDKQKQFSIHSTRSKHRLSLFICTYVRQPNHQGREATRRTT